MLIAVLICVSCSPCCMAVPAVCVARVVAGEYLCNIECFSVADLGSYKDRTVCEVERLVLIVVLDLACRSCKFEFLYNVSYDIYYECVARTPCVFEIIDLFVCECVSNLTVGLCGCNGKSFVLACEYVCKRYLFNALGKELCIGMSDNDLAVCRYDHVLIIKVSGEVVCLCGSCNCNAVDSIVAYSVLDSRLYLRTVFLLTLICKTECLYSGRFGVECICASLVDLPVCEEFFCGGVFLGECCAGCIFESRSDLCYIGIELYSCIADISLTDSCHGISAVRCCKADKLCRRLLCDNDSYRNFLLLCSLCYNHSCGNCLFN